MPRSGFVTSKFVAAQPIPRSCIEGAEYIIQCIARKTISLAWAEGKSVKPHVIAEFGKGITFNISNTKDFHKNWNCVALANYDFGDQDTIDIGEGIILLNRHSSDAGEDNYNMHLGAVVAIEGGYFYISDVSENGTVEMCMDWEVKRVSRLRHFRGTTYPSENYAMGILRHKY